MANRRLFWSFALFFGWLLSFPVSGPILYQLAATRGFNGDEWGLLFSLCHALGFLMIGLSPFPASFWRRAPFWGCFTCLIGTMAIWFIPVGYGAYLMGIMGFGASFFVMRCAMGYAESGTTNKTRFMALVILLANGILYLNNLLCPWAPLGLLLCSAAILLLISFLLPVQRHFAMEPVPADNPPSRFPIKLLFLICLLIFGLDINGGFMYQIIFPSFRPFQEINRYFNLIPYMAALLIVLLTKWNRDKMVLVYLSSALLGLGFVSFALLKASVYQYLLIDTFLLVGFALLDLFIWVMLGDIAEKHHRTSRVFGLGLCANVLPLTLGGFLGARLKGNVENYPATVALLASATIFLTSMLISAVASRIRSDLLHKELSRDACAALEPGVNIAPPQSSGLSSAGSFFSGLALTAREEELLALILDGFTNEDIAGQLQISVNTVKVHVKSIIKKFGVANKNELLALVLKRYQQHPAG